MKRALLFLLWPLLGLASLGQAQTCTLNGGAPYTSATSLSSISSAVNGAADGAVACLGAGEVWTSGTLAITSGSHPAGNKVVVCKSSNGTSCTTTGTNPKIQVSAAGTRCVSISNSADGFKVANLDCQYTASSGAARAWNIEHGTSDVWIDGGVIDGFWSPFYFDDGAGAIVDKLTWGTCTRDVDGHVTSTNRVEIKNKPTTTPTGNRAVSWGALTNSTITLWVHDFNCGDTCGTSHWVDLAQNADNTPTTSSHDVTFECGLYEFNGSSVGNSLHKVNRGYKIVFRDNQFLTTSGTNNIWVIAFGTHGEPTEGLTGSGVDCAGAEIYRNLFIGGGPISNEFAADLCAYNNVFDATTSSTNLHGFMRSFYAGGQTDSTPITNVRVFNNTVYKGNDAATNSLLWRDNPGAPNRPVPTDNRLYNNLVIDMRSNAVGAQVLDITTGGCNSFGSGGVNIAGNFLYSPNDSTPGMTGCSSDDDWIKSGTSPTVAGDGWNQAPGVTNAGAGDFTVSTSSRVCTAGGVAGTPSTDYTGNNRSMACIGAYDISGEVFKDRGKINGTGMRISYWYKPKLVSYERPWR